MRILKRSDRVFQEALQWENGKRARIDPAKRGRDVSVTDTASVGRRRKRHAALPGRSTGDWAEEINAFLARDQSSTMELARLVYCAKRSLHYGDWARLWRDGRIPFSKRKGEMLAFIGKSLGSLDAQTFAHLPIGWSVLYHLAQLDLSTLKRFVRSGIIHPGLTLKQAKELHGSLAPGSRHPNVQQRLCRFQDFVRRTSNDWSEQERLLVQTRLRQLIDELASTRRSCGHPDRILHFPQNAAPATEPSNHTSAL